MKSKLGIDFDKVGHAREMARKIADQVQDFVDGYTTVAVERTLCRLLGIDGVDVHAVPLPNILVDELKEKNVLGEGILFFLGNVMVETGMTPQEIAEQVAAGKVDVTRVPVCTPGQREKALQPYIEASIRRISDNRKRRENYIATIGEGTSQSQYKPRTCPDGGRIPEGTYQPRNYRQWLCPRNTYRHNRRRPFPPLPRRSAGAFSLIDGP